MENNTQDNISSQSGRELTSPISPKRPRTDCTVMNDCRGKSRFDFPELLTFRKNISSPSSPSTLQKNESLIYAGECGDFQDEIPHEQPQDAKLNVTPFTKVTASHSNSAPTGSSKVCFLTDESHPLLLRKDEQPSVIQTDELSFYPGDDSGGSLAESSASASADTPSHLDCKRLEKSLEDETPGGCSLYAGNDEDWRQVQNYVSQIQAFTFTSSNEEVRCQSDCIHKEDGSGFCDTQSQVSKAEGANQKRDKFEFSENIFLSKEEGKSAISSSEYADSKPIYSNPEEEPSGKMEEGGKNGKNKLELQTCENENVSACDGETKGQVNEDGMSETFIPSAAECAEGSILSYDVVLDRNIASENASLEVDDFCGAKEDHAAGKIIAEARSETADHTTETLMPARISQEPAEGDNDAGPFSVIDPAIWSETDREAEEKHCNSESTAGVELSPSVKAFEMEMPLPLCLDVRPSQKVSPPDQAEQFNHQSGKDENERFCQSYIEPPVCSITSNETHNKTGNEGNCQWRSSPSSRLADLRPAGDDGTQQNHDTAVHQVKGQSQPVSFDHLKTQQVKYSQSETDRIEETAEIKEREEITSCEKEMESDEHGNLEKEMKSEEELQLQNEQHGASELSSGDFISEWTDRETPEQDSRSTCTEGELGNKLELFSDQPFSADISVMDVTTEEKERKKVTNVGEEIKTDGHENTETQLKSEDDVQQQNEYEADTTAVSPGEGGSKWTLGGEDVQEHVHSCSSDYQHVAENKDDLLAFTFPSTSDAVVPCQCDVSHSQNAHNSPTALNCSDRFSLLPSAFTLHNSVLGGFDTFKKIQLSPDDDDDDAAGLDNIPVLTSLSRQLLKTPPRQPHHCMPVTESDKHEEIPGQQEEEGEEEAEEAEVEVERFECHIENMANGFVSSDSACNELPNFISAADVIALGRSEQQPGCESAYDSTEHIQHELNPLSVSSSVSAESGSPAPDVGDCSEFEMKTQFDLVLKELNLFFEISRNDFADDWRASPEQCGAVAELSESNTSECREHLSSPELQRHRDTSSEDADEDRRLERCGGDPPVSHAAVSSDGEQEVPFSRYLRQETSVDTAQKHREPQEREQNSKMWSPSFVCPALLEQPSHRPLELAKRLEPLKTCTRPIRVGLSKRARTKHLHRPHPYK